MVAALAGAGIGLGLTLIVAGFIRQPVPVARTRPVRVSARRLAPYLAGMLVGAVVLLVARWPGAAAGSAVLVGVVTSSLAGRREQPRLVEARLDGIATWCEQLRDLLRAGAMLTAAITTTAATSPPILRGAVTRLAARLERERPGDALRRFADELDDPTGDLVAGVLLTATTHSGNTAELLSELADLTRQRVERRKTIEAERSTTRLDMRIILAISAVAVVSMVTFARSEFLRPYRTPTGQLILVAVFAVFVAAVVWAQRLASYQQPQRFLTIADEP